MSTAFVLQGGASLAAGQVGMLRALLEVGIVPDLIVGSSAGAINAVAFAQDPTAQGLARLEHLWTGLRRRAVFPLDPWHVAIGLAGRRDGLVSPRRLRALLAASLADQRLEHARIPVGVVATDVVTGESVTLTHGSTLNAVLASSAIPGLFPPVRIDGRLLTDGGISADIPVLEAEALGATIAYVLPAAPPTESSPTRGALAFLMHSLNHVFDRATLTAMANAQARVTVLPTPRQHVTSPFDFRRSKLLIAEGYAIAQAALASQSAVA